MSIRIGPASSMSIRSGTKRNPSAIYTSTTTTESNTFQKIESNRKYLTFPVDDISIRSEISKDPSTNTSANTTESIDSIKMRTYIILTEKYIVKDYTII